MNQVSQERIDARPDWDSWFMGLCCVAATRGLDESAVHGSVICDTDHRLMGIGYNGFPRNCDDSTFPAERPRKYEITIHSEENCLLNSSNLIVCKNITMYVTGLPCSRCFIKIMQFDITRVVYGNVSSQCVDDEQVFKLADMGGVRLERFFKFDCRESIGIFKGIIS